MTFYDVAYDIRFKTSSFVALDTDADRFKLSNNDKASAGKVYYVRELNYSILGLKKRTGIM